MKEATPQTLPLAIDQSAGKAEDSEHDSLPTLFTPIKIRGLELQNRFVVSPMGTWSASDGHLSDLHLVHLGTFAIRGAALTVVESTAVTPNGRTGPHDAGLWKDSQIAPLKRVVDFIHAQGQKVGVQLNHAGRKTSIMPSRFVPSMKTTIASEQVGGWPDDAWAPSAIAANDKSVIPHALTREGIDAVVQSFADATKRAVQAGIDFIELHGAHAYLIHQFLTPLCNHRTDEYGGSFENRTRFLLRVVEAVRGALPDHIPLSVRLSATEWMEWTGQPCWDLEQTIRLARLLPSAGADMVDVSSGGGHEQQKIELHPRYQIDLAAAVRRALRKEGVPLYVAAVGFIDSPDVARSVVQQDRNKCQFRHQDQDQDQNQNPTQVNEQYMKGAVDPEDGADADLVFVGRQFLTEPGFVLRCAKELNVSVTWPYQFDMAKQKMLKEALRVKQ